MTALRHHRFLLVFISVLFLISTVFSLSASAAEIEPRATQCPHCGSFSVRQYIVGTEEQGLYPTKCIHYLYGEDYHYPIYNIWRESCSNCSYLSDTWKAPSGRERVVCHGYQ